MLYADTPKVPLQNSQKAFSHIETISRFLFIEKKKKTEGGIFFSPGGNNDAIQIK